MDPNSNNPNDSNNTNGGPAGLSWPAAPGGGLNQTTNENLPTAPPPPVSPDLNTLPPTPPADNTSLPPLTPSAPTFQSFDTNAPPTPPTLNPVNPPESNFAPTQPEPQMPATLSPIPTTENSWPPTTIPAAPMQPAQPLTFEQNPIQQTTPPSPTPELNPISLGDPNLLASTPQDAQIVDNTLPPSNQVLSDQASAAIGITTQTGGGAEMPPTSPPSPPIPTMTESAPTDLSHLIGDANNHNGNGQNEVYTPPVSQPENLVVPAQANTVPESISATDHHINLSKLLIISGVVLVLIVSGLSAYFILGVGRATPQPASVPAQKQSELTNPPQPITTPTIQPTQATASSGFGSLQTTPSPKANSAMDLLRQRQQSTSNPTLPPVPR